MDELLEGTVLATSLGFLKKKSRIPQDYASHLLMSYIFA